MTTNRFRNPIIPGFNPDPSICRVGADYFLVTSTFEFFPGLPIYHSKDLTSWTLIGHAITRRSQLDLRTVEPSGGLWAATIRHSNGRFYISVGSMSRFRPAEWDLVIPRGFYVSTMDIWDSTTWSEPVFFDNLGTDQDLFFDDDGKVYLSTVFQITEPDSLNMKHGMGLATHTSEIEIETGRTLTDPVLNRVSDVNIGIAEGPHIFKKDGVYYLTDAEGGTDEEHQQWISRSTTGPFGPWEEGPRGVVNPVLYNGDHPDLRCTGHLDFVEGVDGRWWAVFLGVRPQRENEDAFSQLGRETCLAPVEWVDGWPVVNNHERVGLEVHAEGLGIVEEEQSWHDDFEEPDLALGWYHVRTPLKKEYSLTARPSFLTLMGNPFDLRCSESPCLVLQKQVRFSLDWKTELDFEPQRLGHEAGTTIWWSQFAHASIGIRKNQSNDGREVIFRTLEPEGDEFKEVKHAIPAHGPVELLIRARVHDYELCYRMDGLEMTALGSIASKTLTQRRPRDGPFTGAHFGLYSHGAHSMPCLTPAYFRHARWTAVEE